MELKKIIKSNNIVDVHSNTNTISGKHLEGVKELLLQTDEFKGVDELVILDKPMASLNNKSLMAPTLMLDSNTKFKGRVVLYSIGLTPTIYDVDAEDTIYDEHGISISPIIYSPIDFTPTRYVKLNIKPDIDDIESLRLSLKEQVDKLVGDIDKYSTLGRQKIILRGFFENIESKDDVRIDLDVRDIKTDISDFMITFLKENISEVTGDINLEVVQRFIPYKLKDKWEEEFGKSPRMNITDEVIDDFINDNI